MGKQGFNRVLSSRDNWLDRLLDLDCVESSQEVGPDEVSSQAPLPRSNRAVCDRRGIRRKRFLDICNERMQQRRAEKIKTPTWNNPWPLPTNRGPSKRIPHYMCGSLNNATLNMEPSKSDFFGGFDGGFTVNFYGRWFVGSEAAFVDLCNHLDKLKEKAQQNERSGVAVHLPIQGESWRVLPNGTGTGVKYRWVLSLGGARIAIHSNPKGNIAPVCVTLGYEAIAHYDLEQVLAKIETVLENIGFTVEGDKVSRVDIQITMRLPFSVVEETLNEKRFVNRLYKHKCNYGVNGLETITWGAGKNRKIEVCIYNKTQELLDNPEASYEKALDLLDVFGEEGCDNLTRIEFRLFRPALNAFHIDSYFDLLADLPNVVEYLTHNYFRALADKRSKGNEHTQEMASWWLDVVRAFREYFGDGVKRVWEGPRRCRINSIAFGDLMTQAAGCFSAAFATLPSNELGEFKDMTYTEFKEAAIRAMLQSMPEAYQNYLRKRALFCQNLEPLDMSFVEERRERKLRARDVREARRAQLGVSLPSSSDVEADEKENEYECFLRDVLRDS